MKYYYLISGKLYWANSEMPKLTMYSPFYDSEIMIWKDSLQPCEITEGELIRIKDNIKDYWHTHNNPINVTDLVEEDINLLFLDTHVVKFKHSKQVDEASEAVIDDILKILNIPHTKDSGWYNHVKETIFNQFTITRNI